MTRRAAGASALCAALAGGCVTVPSGQTARALPPGAERLGASLGVLAFARALGPAWLVAAADDTPLDFLHLHLSYRRGLSERLDLGVSTLSFVAYAGDFKWTAYDSPRWTLATGAGAGIFLPMFLPILHVEGFAPLYLTVRPAPALSLTLAARAAVYALVAKLYSVPGGATRTSPDAFGGGSATLTAFYSFRRADLMIETGLSRAGFLWFSVGTSVRRRSQAS